MTAEYWRTWTSAFLFFGGFYALLVPLALYLAACDFADWQVGIILGAFGIAALIGRPLAGVCADVWGRGPLLRLGALSLLIGAGGVPFTKAAAPLFVLRIMQAVGYVAFTTAISARVADLAEPHKKGSALALFGVSINLAITVTPMAVNALLPTIKVNGAFAVAAGLAAAAALLSLSRTTGPHITAAVGNWTTVFQLNYQVRCERRRQRRHCSVLDLAPSFNSCPCLLSAEQFRQLALPMPCTVLRLL